MGRASRPSGTIGGVRRPVVKETTTPAAVPSGAQRMLALISNEEENDTLRRYGHLLAGEILKDNPQFAEFLPQEVSLPEGDAREFIEKEATRQGVQLRFLDGPPGSVQFGSNVFLLAQQGGLVGTSPGLGGNFVQGMPANKIAVGCRDMQEADKIFLSRSGTLDAKMRELGGRSGALADSLAEVYASIEDLREIRSNVDLHSLAHMASEESILSRAKARLDYEESLAVYAEIIEKMEAAEKTMETFATAENLSAWRQIREEAEKATDVLLAEPLRAAEEIAAKHGAKLSSKSELLRFAAWSDAIDGLDGTKSINGAATWAYISRTLASDDPDQWRHNPKGQELVAVARGAQLVDTDEKLQAVSEQLLAEEDELRLQARLLGKIPESELIYMPAEEWTPGGARSFQGPAGEHLSHDPQRPSFAYLSTMNKEHQSDEDLLAAARNVTVHELIHAGQPVYRGEDAAFTSLDEGITETLTQMRRNKNFAANPDADHMPESTAYPHLVRPLLRILDDAGVPPSDRELLLEHLSAMTHKERLQEIGRLRGGDGRDAWLELSGG